VVICKNRVKKGNSGTGERGPQWALTEKLRNRKKKHGSEEGRGIEHRDWKRQTTSSLKHIRLTPWGERYAKLSTGPTRAVGVNRGGKQQNS